MAGPEGGLTSKKGGREGRLQNSTAGGGVDAAAESIGGASDRKSTEKFPGTLWLRQPNKTLRVDWVEKSALKLELSGGSQSARKSAESAIDSEGNQGRLI